MVNAEHKRIEDIREKLKSVTDPEIPVLTIEDMGVLKEVYYEDDTLVVEITPTYTGCPAMDMITVNIKAALQEIGIDHVEVKQKLFPPWTTDWLSDEGKAKLKAYGIAPPVEKTSDKSFLKQEQATVPCPLCESTDTELISQFGSTACKALYRCKTCKEPFDYFKCH